MSTIVGTNIEVTNIKYDSDTTSMIISSTGQITAQGEGTSTTNLQSGLCKAWVRTYAAAVNITDSFNISSVTDSAVGKYAPQINNNMANGNYAVCLGGDDKQDGGSVMVHNIDDSVDQATTGYGTSFKKYSYAITDNNQNAASMVLGLSLIHI